VAYFFSLADLVITLADFYLSMADSSRVLADFPLLCGLFFRVGGFLPCFDGFLS
jgi:hypothetical protein